MERSRERWVRYLASIAIVAGLSPAAWGAPIAMPEGSTVWMKGEANTCPDADGDDCVGSNLPGTAPPNGIPLTTFGPANNPATFYAEILTDSIRTYGWGQSAAFLRASFVDTYMVHGAASGTFSITVTLDAEGKALSRLSGVHSVSASMTLEIGTWNPGSYVSGIPVAEQFRVTPFGPSSVQTVSIQLFNQTAAFEIPFAASVTHTQTVGVGDTFDIAYCVNSASSLGGIDMLDTGARIDFILPEGVWITSENGGVWGEEPAVPVGPWVRIGAVLGLLGGAIRGLRPARSSRGHTRRALTEV